MVRAPLCLLCLRHQDVAENQVLRVRSKTCVQEVLRQVSSRIAQATQEGLRSNAEKINCKRHKLTSSYHQYWQRAHHL